jgi:hypothetical protein
MFVQVYQSQPVDITVNSDIAGLSSIYGLVSVFDPNPSFENKLLAMCGMSMHGPLEGLFRFPHWFTWDEVTGTFFRRDIAVNISSLITISVSGLIKTRLGRLALTFGTAGFVDSSLVAPFPYPGADQFIPPFFNRPDGGANGCPAIDEVNDTYMDRSSYFGSDTWVVWQYTTKQVLGSIQMPANIIASTLEDENKVYLLCSDGNIVLLDYLRFEVLGIGRLPQYEGGVPGSPALPAFGSEVAITWDNSYKRLYVFSMSFLVDGKPTIRGYRMVSRATRLTHPVPLKYPKKGRIVPVLSQLVGNNNEGVGGSIVRATATGPASAVNTLSLTDIKGGAIFNLLCQDAGIATITVTAD